VEGAASVVDVVVIVAAATAAAAVPERCYQCVDARLRCAGVQKREAAAARS
jgi:hypothetical protein